MEQTLSIIKPDATSKGHIGAIVDRFEKAGIHIAAMRMVYLTEAQVTEFYAIHKEKPFFGELLEFMTSGPSVVMVLEGEGVIAKNREIMGATDPKKAAPGTIRADFADSIDCNAVHGSDAPETAAVEIPFFFKPNEIFSRASM